MSDRAATIVALCIALTLVGMMYGARATIDYTGGVKGGEWRER